MLRGREFLYDLRYFIYALNCLLAFQYGVIEVYYNKYFNRIVTKWTFPERNSGDVYITVKNALPGYKSMRNRLLLLHTFSAMQVVIFMYIIQKLHNRSVSVKCWNTGKMYCDGQTKDSSARWLLIGLIKCFVLLCLKYIWQAIFCLLCTVMQFWVYKMTDKFKFIRYSD